MKQRITPEEAAIYLDLGAEAKAIAEDGLQWPENEYEIRAREILALMTPAHQPAPKIKNQN